MLKTFNNYHLGDNIIHLNWLRKLREPIEHYCQPQYIAQLRPIVEDAPHITLHPISQRPVDSVDSWINAHSEYVSPWRDDWAFFHLRHFEALAKKLGVENPSRTTDSLRCDWPKLKDSSADLGNFDVLCINSEPKSNQFPAFSHQAWRNLVSHLKNKGLRCVTTAATGLVPSTIEAGLDVSDIGHIASKCNLHISMNTGPLWPTFNTLADPTYRIVLCNIHTFPLHDGCITLRDFSQIRPVLDRLGY